jgi:hypothetical protein
MDLESGETKVARISKKEQQVRESATENKVHRHAEGVLLEQCRVVRNLHKLEERTTLKA